MKNLLFILLFISQLALGQAITITPNNSALFDAKGTSNQLLLKNDTLKMTNAVFAIKNANEIIDQQNSTNQTFYFYTDNNNSAIQTFTAGMNGKLTKIDLKFDGTANFTLKIFDGDTMLGENSLILIATKNFSSSNGWFSIVLDTPVAITSGNVYTIAVDNINTALVGWAFNIGNMYSGGASYISANADYFFKTYCKPDYGLVVNGSGNVSAGGIFYGNGSGLTNLNLPTTVTLQGNVFNGASQLLKLNSAGNISQNANQTIFPINVRANTAVAGEHPVLAIENNANVPRWHLVLSGGNDFNFVESGVANYRLYLKQGGNVGIGTNNPLERLEVTGNVKGTAFINSSDIRFKKDFSKIENPLVKILTINGLYYNWRKDEFPNRGFDDSKQVGFIAQDLEKIFPEVVFTDKEGFKSVDYPKLTPLLVEAIKELKKENDGFRKELETIKNLILNVQNGK